MWFFLLGFLHSCYANAGAMTSFDEYSLLLSVNWSLCSRDLACVALLFMASLQDVLWGDVLRLCY